MPYSPPSRTPSGPRRRSFLASAAGAALLVGCSSGSEDSDTEESTGGSPSLVERVRARAAQQSRGMVERYDAALVLHPALTERVGALRTEAVRHVEAFGGTVASASVSASPTASTAAVTEKDTLADLAAAERALADERAQTLLEVPGELARLMASVAAAGAAHAYLLTEAAK